ncbi:hypothetical protein F4678DRAFT_461756 [Xylaria arbuscula]|nr:hypothetical protein F4678DRAFT_461756 [Xylaria arbuscula]
MKPKAFAILLLSLITQSTNIVCEETSIETQTQELSTTLVTDPAAALDQSTTSPTLTAPLLPTRRQYTAALAARTTTPFTVTATPIRRPLSEDEDENNNSNTAENAPFSPYSSSLTTTIQITITRNSTTTVRPTVTLTSLFSSLEPTTSGAGRRLEYPGGFYLGLIMGNIFALCWYWLDLTT